MARAKRTERAEARRRYRAAMGDPALDSAPDELEETEDPRRSEPVARSPQAPQRPSVVGAFRESFRPLDLRGDLRALPRLLMTKAFLIPAVLSSGSFLAFALDQNPLTVLVYQWLSFQFPVAAVFGSGFFAPRASWLLGLILALGSTILQLPFFTAIYPTDVIWALLAQGAVLGSFFGAAAAWYRRFLSRANPNRMAARPQSTTSHRPDGKIPKRNSQRPILARRR